MSIALTPTITLFSRADWGARAPRAMADQGNPREAFLHHSDDDPDATRRIDSLEEQKAKMRQIQNYHMDTKGWSDIAYHYIVQQAYGNIPNARIFAGRDIDKVPAAQEGHNTGTLAICVVGDFSQGGNDLKSNTRYAIEVLLNRDSRSFLSLRVLGGHRDVVATSCPGINIYRDIPTIADAVNLAVYS
jgi:N-acetylmuramoyl-L-alanine amidase